MSETDEQAEPQAADHDALLAIREFLRDAEDPQALAAVAGKIAEAAMRLQNACLTTIADAAPDAPAEAQS